MGISPRPVGFPPGEATSPKPYPYVWLEMGHLSIQNGTGGVFPHGYVFWGHSPIWVHYLASDEATALIPCK